MQKQFMVVEVSVAPIQDDDIYGYVLLGKDAEMWRVARPRPDFLPSWTVRDIVAVPIRYVGPEQLTPDWEVMACHCSQRMIAKSAHGVVAQFWGQGVADRFVQPAGHT